MTQLWPLVPAAAVCAAAVFFLQRARKRYLKQAEDSGPQLEVRASAQRFLGFEDIRDGIVVLPGGRYRLVLEVVGTVNFPLLSETEQDNIEASFRTLVASLTFPVQFYTQTRQIDLSRQIQGIEERMPGLPTELRRYARELSQYLAAWARYSPLVRKNYVVIHYDAGPGEDRFSLARQELLRRAEVVGSELSRWLKWRKLTTDEVVELLYTVLNKERSAYARARDAVDHGFFEPYVSGRRPEVTGSVAKEGRR
ncbi:MAG: hypothetical protein ACPLPR_01475 [Bacillota bacterium]